MSLTAELDHGPIERRWQYLRPPGGRPVAAVLTSVGVVVGCVLALLLVPPPNTPFHTAEAYVQARVEEDANAAWALLCPDVRQRVTLAAFTVWMEELNRIAGMPSEVSVAFDGITGGPSDGLIAVSLTLTSSEWSGWSSSGEVLVEQQGNEFFVCDDAVSPLL